MTEVAPSELTQTTSDVKPALTVGTEPERRRAKSMFGGGSLSRKGMGMRWKFWKAAPIAVSAV